MTIRSGSPCSDVCRITSTGCSQRTKYSGLHQSCASAAINDSRARLERPCTTARCCHGTSGMACRPTSSAWLSSARASAQCSTGSGSSVTSTGHRMRFNFQSTLEWTPEPTVSTGARGGAIDSFGIGARHQFADATTAMRAPNYQIGVVLVNDSSESQPLNRPARANL